MSDTMLENANIVNKHEENIVLRKRGRPKKTENKEERIKQYNKKIIEEKGEAYNKMKNNITKYNERCRKSYQILRNMLEEYSENIPEKYREDVLKLFTVQSE